MNAKNPVPRSYKVIVLGEAGVGKSSLIRRCTTGNFSPRTTTTIGVNRISTTIEVEPESSIDFEILDTAGCFAFHTLIKSYITNLDAVIFVYDLTDKESFACLPLWNSIINKTQEKKLVKVLVGNKNDLVLHREVQFKNAKNYADFEGMVSFEVSAKTEESDDVFRYLAKELKKNDDNRTNDDSSNNNNNNINTTEVGPFSPKRPKSADCTKFESSDSSGLSGKFKSLFKSRRDASENPKEQSRGSDSYNTSVSLDENYKCTQGYITDRFHYIE